MNTTPLLMPTTATITSTENTGDATPGPGAEVLPFERYNPYIEPVEAGNKEELVFFEDRTI